MSNKRKPTTELNHDNWNQEEEKIEPGIFEKASDDILSRRIVKTARRRLPQSEDGTTKSAFGSFTGFKTTAVTNSASPFSFLRSNSSASTLTTSNSNLDTIKTETNGSATVSENGTSSLAEAATSTEPKTAPTNKESASSGKPPEYYAKLKGLNQGVAKWIKTHVDVNPVCILTPIFRDYEKYLKDIEQKHGKKDENSKVTEGVTETKIEPPKTTESEKPAVTEAKKPSLFVFGSSGSKPASEGQSPISIFAGASNPDKSVFSSNLKSDNKCPFGIKSDTSSDKNIFSSKSPVENNKKDEESKKVEEKPAGLTFSQTATTANSGPFSFGQSPSTTSTLSAGFSFGSGKPFTFGNAAVSKPQDSEEKKNEEKEDDDDEPPKPDFKPITEEGSIFEQRCKVYVKKDGNYSDRGVGTLFLKPAPNDKMQLIIRAVNSLGNILLNTMLTESIPTKKLNKNSVMIVCLPLPTAKPPPVATLLRVKTEEEADALLEALEKHKK
ncbi:nuclear pore complex protein Nup50 [Copidosoma floridanum]|uniref:nuclear pore complex protein Nup50 n=1 Tax=Copidosoma floridanum TaxID=29053 RepID=UPI0006C95C3A|nr:nuclear pore complex protein Nup50 [Copidosoma floridanum]XP_014219583.1 nuclear pore complex protein Nup50 [Copidosoma floridanum]XP_014219584.1 nuclear pore complex protein Nup50 [Copidosoma floridanum]